jgi:uncharacterized protein (TIGR04255 family)
MGAPLKNPPVYFTVAQVRFNALLKLAEYLPSIQEAMRRAGFPDFVSHKSIALQIVMQDGQAVPTPLPQERFLFGTTDRAHCFVMGPEFLTLQSTNYGTFEEFSGMFLKGLERVHELVQLDFIDRVGLRYLDHVAPRAPDTLDKYLAPEVLGMSARFGGTPVHSFSETLNVVKGVRLLSRVVIQSGGLSFPPDLLPENMEINKKFLAYNGHHALLDTDGSVEGREVFSSDFVWSQLQAIHEVIGTAFKATVTKHALKIWDEK